MHQLAHCARFPDQTILRPSLVCTQVAEEYLLQYICAVVYSGVGWWPAAGGHCNVASRSLHARSDRSQAWPTRHSRLVTSYDNPPADLVSARLADQVIAQYATFSPPNLINNLSIFSSEPHYWRYKRGAGQ